MLSFDHIYPTPGQGLSSPPRTAILHASFQSTNFRQLHSHLLRLSSGPAPRIQYIFRPIPPDGVVGEKSYLTAILEVPFRIVFLCYLLTSNDTRPHIG